VCEYACGWAGGSDFGRKLSENVAEELNLFILCLHALLQNGDAAVAVLEGPFDVLELALLDVRIHLCFGGHKLRAPGQNVRGASMHQCSHGGKDISGEAAEADGGYVRSRGGVPSQGQARTTP